jgi:hypothetical protein
MMKVFEVEIVQTGESWPRASAVLKLPATESEYQDAMQKVRLTGDMPYNYEICYCKHDWLRSRLPEAADLRELNMLAERIQNHIRDDMDVFEAMVTIDAGRTNSGATPLPRLINMTHSIDNCHVVGNITSDALLGKFLYNNDFLSEKDAGAVQSRIRSNRPVSDLFTMLGKEHRASTGGVLTASGRYVEFDGSVEEVYTPGKMESTESQIAPVTLRLFNDGKTVHLALPAEPSRIEDVQKTLGIADLSNHTFVCTDCIIPAAKNGSPPPRILSRSTLSHWLSTTWNITAGSWSTKPCWKPRNVIISTLHCPWQTASMNMNL